VRRSRRRALLILGVFAALALVYGAVSWVFSAKLIGQQFTPLGEVGPADVGLPQPEVVSLPGDGVTLAGWYFANPRGAGAGCAVVMLHGFSGSKEEVLAPSPIFWDRGCDLLLYDARGHGHSSRALLTYGAHERQDLRLAVEWLSRRSGLPLAKIGLIGWSYGAATSIQAASELDDLAFVIADSSYSSLGDIAREQAESQFGSWAKLFVPGALLVSGLRAGFDPRAAAPEAAIRDVLAPVLLIHSRQDAFTPAEHSELIFAASDPARTRLVIPDWEAPHAHSFTNDRVAYTAIVDDFLTTFAPEFGIRLER
jgi:uncharacterized protein